MQAKRANVWPAWMSAAACLTLSGCYSGHNEGLADEAPGPEGGSAADDGDEGADDGSGSDGGGPDEPACADGPGVASRPMPRLSTTQYQNTIRDLLGDPEFVASFDERQPYITEAGVRALQNDAELAWSRRAMWGTTIGCDLQGSADDACAEAWIDTLAPRAFRRPLSAADRQVLVDVYHDELQVSSFENAMMVLTEVILNDPALVYRLESGPPSDGGPGEIVALDGYGLASRLSYFLWESMPDETLFALAQSGTLTDPSVLDEQVDRMLASPRATATMQRFAWELLDLEAMTQDAEKDAELFPEFDDQLSLAMRTEFDAVVARVFEEHGTLQELLTTRSAYVNGPLAELYGVQGPSDPGAWAWVELPPDQRSGLLTRASFLSAYAGSRTPSPIRRGVTVLENVLCNELGSPPANANDTADPMGGDDAPQTVREQITAQTSHAECTGCHSTINAVGFTFERYDALGRWQDLELVSELPIDSSGSLPLGETAGDVADAVELSERIADSSLTSRCVSLQMFNAALGSDSEPAEMCAQQAIVDEFSEDGDLHALIKAIVMSSPFLFTNTADSEEEGQ